MFVLRALRELWGPWWPLPLVPAVYSLAMLGIGDLRPEHVVFAVGCVALGYAGPRSKRFLSDVLPYVFVGLGYDSMRYVLRATLARERVLGCELRNAELSFFGVGPNTTLQDVFVTLNSPAFDLLFAVPYAIFAYVALAYATYLYFADRARMRHYLWSFAIANYLSFALWVLIPAAPPWYLRAHGCAIDLATLPSPAALARVDALLGVAYFDAFYSRTSQVFGAMPSMHCAYPLIGLLTAWRAASWRTRPLHLLYVAMMFAASVYLDHHWVLDGLAGWAVGAVSVWAAALVLRRLLPRARAADFPEARSESPEPLLHG